MAPASYALHLEDERATARFGAVLARALAPGDVVALEGDLGAGKTTLVRATARSLGVPETIAVTSPTFVLVHELPAPVPVIHVDLYRLGDPDELAELGLEEWVDAEAIVLVEWGERFDSALGGLALVVRLGFGEGSERHVRLEPRSARGTAIAQGITDAWGAV